MTHTYKITIAYDGTSYCGWQVQNGVKTIQELIQNALFIIFKEKTDVTGAGRTDAGVHALAQTAHFKINNEIDTTQTKYSLNGILPKDIRITEIEKVSNDFHSRYNAKDKIYHYFLTTGSYQSPFDRQSCFHMNQNIDFSLLIKASKYFIGTHDFTSFANDHLKGCAANKPIKTITALNIKKINNNKIVFEFHGDGFLYKMVRNIVGTLLDIATHKIDIEDLPSIFKAKDRRKAGTAAPAKGLFLVKINYK